MRTNYREFRLNKADGKIMGVCAGLSDHFEIDVTLMRVAMVMALILTFPIVGFAYLAVALLAQSQDRRAGYGRYGETRIAAGGAESSRDRMRDLDMRLQAIERSITQSNNALAREIDELR